MDDREREEVRKILKCCQVPSMRSHLCERIIIDARKNGQCSRWSAYRYGVQDFMDGLSQVLMIPKPAYSFAGVMVFSVVIGLNSDFSEYLSQHNSIVAPISYMHVDHSFGGEFDVIGVTEESLER